MNTLGFGLSVAAIGMLVVFAGLIILIVSVKGISLLAGIKGKKKNAAPEKASAPASPAVSAASAPATEGISPEVVAAITAAINVVWQGGNGLTVRHIKRIHHAPAWNRAGREEQTYSRY